MTKKAKELSKTLTRTVPIALIVSGFIGLFSSFFLAVETVNYIRDPGAQLSCSINPIVSCSSVIDTPQGNILGFMNPLLGIVGFSMLIVFGMAVLYKAKFPKWIWILAQVTSTSAIVFVHWLIYNSIYVLGSLCPYCMVVWAVSMPIALYITLRNVNEGLLGKTLKDVAPFLNKNHYLILLAWYVLVIVLIVNHFGLSSLFA